MQRLARWLGAIPEATAPTSGANTNPIEQARQAGIPVIEGQLPHDPNLAFLDMDIPLGKGLNDV